MQVMDGVGEKEKAIDQITDHGGGGNGASANRTSDDAEWRKAKAAVLLYFKRKVMMYGGSCYHKEGAISHEKKQKEVNDSQRTSGLTILFFSSIHHTAPITIS